MPLNIPTSPITMFQNPLYNPTGSNINISQINAPLLLSSVLSGNDTPLSSFINYEYEDLNDDDDELINMEEGFLLPKYTRVFKNKNSNLYQFSFSDKGRKIKKITL